MTSRRTELLIGLNRDRPKTLRLQVERQIRDAIRAGSLKAGATLPSSRELARQLAVSRPLVSEAYAQLAAEGYVSIRQGAVPWFRHGSLVPRPSFRGLEETGRGGTSL